MKPRRELPPIGEVVAALAARAESLCHELLPGGRRDGHEWTVPSAASPFGCSMSVHLGGARSGVWAAWAAGGSRDNGSAGDALDLVAQIKCQGDKGDALRWARGWLGWDAGDQPGGEAGDQAATRQPPPPVRGTGDAEEIEQRRRAAQAIWLYAQPSLKGTPAELYLRGRGIDLAVLGRQPRALRYHPELYNSVSGRSWPALVAAITRPDADGNSQFVAVHQTWLTPDGRKAPIVLNGKSEAKRTFGAYRGGAIALWRGAGTDGRPGKSLRDAPAGSAVWIAEGIEDALSIAILGGGADRVLAAVSLANMGNLILPPAITRVGIVAQNDPFWLEGRDQTHPTVRGLDRAIRHFQAEGREVVLWRVPAEAETDAQGQPIKDANDFLRWQQRQHGAAVGGMAA